MKKVLFTIAAGAALILAGCNKEADNAPEQKIGKTYTIKATVENPETRTVTSLNTTTQKYEFAWEAGELIGVLPDGNPTVLQFQLAEGSDDTFTYVAEPGAPEYTSFGLAVTPMDALSPEDEGGEDFSYVDGSDVNYYVNLSGSYTQGQSNAVMVASSPETQGDGSQKFSFKHLAALVRVTYENIPEGVLLMEFTTPDHPITGTFHFTTVEGAQIVAGDFPAGESDPMGEAWVILPEYTGTLASADFYLPIPTGSYSTFNVKLYDENGDLVPGSQRTFSTASPFTVARADVVECPVITLDAPETLAGEWIMVGKKDNDYYAAQAFESGNSNLRGANVTVSGNAVTSATYIPVKMTFTYVSEGTYAGMYTIQDANGNYLYAASSSSNHLKAKDTIDESTPEDFYWNITEGGNGVYSIIASESDNRNVLRFNYNGGNNSLFSCYESTSTTGTNVRLYKWADADIPNPTCATPEISCQNNVITITTATAGATIYYVIGADATVADPTTASSVYDPANKPTISANGYVKAIAVAAGYSNSEVAGAAVTYKAPVVLAGWVETNLSEIVAGDVFVMVANEQYALPHDGSSAPVLVSVTVADSKLTAEPAANIQWNLTGNSTDGYTFYPNGNTAKYLRCTTTASSGSNDNIRINTGIRNVFLLDSGNHIVTNDTYTDRYIGINGTSNFRGYVTATSATEACFKFFKYYDDGKQNAGISFTPASASVTWGETLTQPTLNNEHGLAVTYATSDPSVASLNGTTIVVNKVGTATITASWAEQTIGDDTYRAGNAVFVLTVNKAAASVAFNNPVTTLDINGTQTNVATASPSSLAVTYSSSNPTVATVNSTTGQVTGVSNGTAVITATVGNDYYETATASYTITVGSGSGSDSVEYDFTGSDWTVNDRVLSNGEVSFTGDGSANFKMNDGYFMMGKSGAYINFPAYTKSVSKIVVTGRSGASAAVKQNIYVGSTAVSTETTGATGTNTYNIASGSQAVGTIYTLKVTSAHNTQITKIEVFFK